MPQNLKVSKMVKVKLCKDDNYLVLNLGIHFD